MNNLLFRNLINATFYVISRKFEKNYFIVIMNYRQSFTSRDFTGKKSLNFTNLIFFRNLVVY